VNLPSDADTLQALVSRMHGKPVQRSDDGYANWDYGSRVIEGEGIDYRHDEFAGSGPGGIKKPEGPSQI
jgi:hypothetical protein